MKITFAPRGILQIDDARITYRNFSGAPSQFNRKGDRDFSLIIPDQETADALIQEGWNVKIKPPRVDGDEPFMYMKVKVKYNENGGPIVRVQTDMGRAQLNEETIGSLDKMDILSVCCDIRPYDWELSDGKSGRTAYLKSMLVFQDVDRFADRH